MFETALELLGDRIAYGPGRAAGVAEDAVRSAGAGVRVLLVADPGVAAAGLAMPVEAALVGRGIPTRVFTDVRSDPLAGQIDAAAAAARDHGATLVVGLGGGSALDAAKLAAGLAPSGRGAAEVALLCDPFDGPVLPVIAIPTTAGTGAEVTASIVYTLPDGAKVWVDAGNLRPRLALLDPELTVGLPARLTAATGVDALVHAIESLTGRRTKPQTRSPGLEAIRLIRRHLPVAVRAPDDLEARGGMLLAACLAGLAIDSGGTAFAHAMGHALGALGRVHHGRAVGLCLRAVLAGNAEAAPAAHAAVAEAFGLSEGGEAELAGALAPAYDAFLRAVGLDISLADHGLGEGDIERIAAETLKPENRPMLRANARELDEADLRDLAREIVTAR